MIYLIYIKVLGRFSIPYFAQLSAGKITAAKWENCMRRVFISSPN